MLRNGGTAFVCTQGDGTLNGWLPPNFPQGANFGAALSPLLAANAMEGTAGLGTGGSYGLTTPRPQSAASNAIPKPPIGYKLAWEDDRLNPLRGVGTAQGQAQQDLIWTRRVPAGLVAAQPLPLLPRWVLPVLQTNVSTMSAPVARAAAPAAPGGRMVQIGSYGQPANAQGAARRLATLGLPVATGQITTGSKALQIVYAGPFATNSEAEAALSAARGAGFGDAFLN